MPDSTGEYMGVATPLDDLGRHALAAAPAELGTCVSKRLFDFVLTVVSAPLWLSVLALIALAVRIDGRGPVFFTQNRLGFRGNSFRMWKFRSMVADADCVLERHLREHPELQQEWEQTQKLKCDPRVTRLGKFLRRSSLDELPQFFNVLRGEMSLVGPRPIIEGEGARYGSRYHLYLAARPGLTGLWQVSGRNNTTYDERVLLDTEYVLTWNLMRDVRILVVTFGAVLKRDGAY